MTTYHIRSHTDGESKVHLERDTIDDALTTARILLEVFGGRVIIVTDPPNPPVGDTGAIKFRP